MTVEKKGSRKLVERNSFVRKVRTSNSRKSARKADDDYARYYKYCGLCVFLISIGTIVYQPQGWVDTVLNWRMPSAYAQCAVRRSFPPSEAPAAFWNISATSSFSLPPAWSNDAVITYSVSLPVFNFTTNQTNIVHENRTTTIRALFHWNCHFDERKYPPALTRSIQLSDDLSSLKYYPELRINSEPINSTAPVVVYCRIRPVVYPAYQALHNQWVLTKQLGLGFSNDTIIDFEPHLPWNPCNSDDAYTDNLLRIYMPTVNVSISRISSSNEQANTSTSSPTPIQIVKFGSAENLHPSFAETVKVTLDSKQKAALTIHALCEDIAGRSESPYTVSGTVQRKYLRGLTALTTPTIDGARSRWVPIINTHPEIAETGEDDCSKKWGQRLLRVVESNTNQTYNVFFDATAHSPVIYNPFVSEIPKHVDCLADIVRYATERLSDTDSQDKVKYTHPCMSTGDPVSGVRYTWSYTQAPDPEKPNCVHRGLFYHRWNVNTCGQNATATVITRVLDSKPPVLDSSNPLLNYNAQKGLHYIQKCIWPLGEKGSMRTMGQKQMFCLNDRLQHDLAGLFRDSCFTSQKLDIIPKWDELEFFRCSTSFARNREPTCHNLDVHALPRGFVSVEPNDVCIDVLDFDFKANVLRISVPVSASDPCGNSDPLSPTSRVTYGITIVDPMRVYYERIRSKLCS